MNNPWTNIEAQSIHPDDTYWVRKHNREVAKRSPAQTVRSYLPPSPYQGDPRRARIILLAKNPSFEEADEQDAVEYPAIEEENRKAMTFESDCPFYYLDSRFKNTAGYRWWANTLENVLEAGAQRGVDRHTRP